MRVAVLSDIHSNYHALKACYEDAVRCGAERFLFLGDYVSDLAEPRKTLDLVYEIRKKYPTVCLRGNREGYMLDCEAGASTFTRGSKSGSLLFTYMQLRKEDLDFFRGLKISDTVLIGSVRLEIAHASMDNDRYFFTGDDDRTAEVFRQMRSRYLLTGHSHSRYIRHASDKTIINPGSVGIPQDGTVEAKYALLDIENEDVTCQLREVPYDIPAVIRCQFSNGLVEAANYWAIGVLYDLINAEECVLKLLERVRESGDFQDEEVWHREAVKMGMRPTEAEILEYYNSL